jgi:hexokinase
MKIEDLHPSKREDLAEGVETVVINTEWTIRGTDKPLIDMKIKTIWDAELDKNSDAPGFQPFEYMTSGRYLGEIVRLVFVDIVATDLEAHLPPSLSTKNAIPTRFLSEVVARLDEETVTKELQERYAAISSPTTFWTPARVKLVRDIAYSVQQRSSALIAAACVGLLACVHDVHIDHNKRSEVKQNGNPTSKESEIEELVIAYAGGTISQYPEWLESCQKWIDTLVTKASPANASKRVVLKEALDGGIIGAGVLAGMIDNIA